MQRIIVHKIYRLSEPFIVIMQGMHLESAVEIPQFLV